MNWYWLLFELGINLFEGWMYTLFLRKQLNIRHQYARKTVLLLTLGTVILVAGFYSLYIPFDIPVSDSVVFGFTFIYSLILFSDAWYIKLLWNIVTGVVLVAIASLISQLFMYATNASWPMLMQPSLLRLGFVLCANIVLFMTYYVITKLKSSQEKLSRIALTLFIVLNAVILVALEMQYNLSWQPNVLRTPVLITIFCMLFVSAGLLGMFELLSYKAAKQAELELEIETTNLTASHLEEVRSIYQRMMEYEHDMKHQINTLQQMIDQGKLSESSAYLNELRRIALPVHFATGCISVDALLSAKSAYLDQHQIDFVFNPYPLNELPVEAPVLCAIIGNLLDNAIEAIHRIHPKTKRYEVYLSFSRTRDMFFITCKNETGGISIKRQGSRFMSSKRKHRIGYGITSIRHSIEQAEGYTSFRVEDDVFIAEIVIPFKQGGAVH